MATLLDSRLLEETLDALPGWHGDQDAIWRELHLAPEQDAELRREVEVTAAAMGHSATVQRVKGGTRFALQTPEVGGVSELDIAMASHISDVAHRLAKPEPGVDAVRHDDPEVQAEADAGSDLQESSALEERMRFGSRR